MNIFMVKGSNLITPPVTSNLLEGITRRTLLQLAQEELDLEVIERDIDRTELYLVEEAFFCGTGVQVAAIGSIDHRVVGNGRTGPITQKLRDLYFRVVMGQESKYMGWLTSIPVLEPV